jgi:hypothetical protein
MSGCSSRSSGCGTEKQCGLVARRRQHHFALLTNSLIDLQRIRVTNEGCHVRAAAPLASTTGTADAACARQPPAQVQSCECSNHADHEQRQAYRARDWSRRASMPRHGTAWSRSMRAPSPQRSAPTRPHSRNRPPPLLRFPLPRVLRPHPPHLRHDQHHHAAPHPPGTNAVLRPPNAVHHQFR